jgi:hypothetical protein
MSDFEHLFPGAIDAGVRALSEETARIQQEQSTVARQNIEAQERHSRLVAEIAGLMRSDAASAAGLFTALSHDPQTPVFTSVWGKENYEYKYPRLARLGINHAEIFTQQLNDREQIDVWEVGRLVKAIDTSQPETFWRPASFSHYIKTIKSIGITRDGVPVSYGYASGRPTFDSSGRVIRSGGEEGIIINNPMSDEELAPSHRVELNTPIDKQPLVLNLREQLIQLGVALKAGVEYSPRTVKLNDALRESRGISDHERISVF